MPTLVVISKRGHQLILSNLDSRMEETEMDGVERVARALCQADGKNPDEQVATGETEVLINSGPLHERHTPQSVTQARWKTYKQEAQRFIAAFDAYLTPPARRRKS
jgi:hypothetical protein